MTVRFQHQPRRRRALFSPVPSPFPYADLPASQSFQYRPAFQAVSCTRSSGFHLYSAVSFTTSTVRWLKAKFYQYKKKYKKREI